MNAVPARRRFSAALCGLAIGLALVPLAPQRLGAEELVDITLLFHSAVQGKIAPCG